MKVDTPMICWHEREPIYSIDLQPGNHNILRLVTACVDKTLRMWDVKVGNDGKCDIQFLSTLSRHSRSVNACRFSPDGDTLASAGDDCAIAFWKLNETPAPGNNLFQDDDEENKEVWVIFKMLRGHLEDVYDICWSADGKFLISGSVDNSAILWDIQKDTKLALLNEHKSFVQGVAWDPLNEFVATLSTDRSCRVFSITGKNCLHNVSKMTIPTQQQLDNKPKPFKMFHDDGIGSFFRRLAFSPCGQFLITPAGCVEQGDKVTSATFVFTRNNLSKPALYLPSPDKATLAVRVCPQLFTLRKVNKDLNHDHENNNLKEWEKSSTLFCLPYRVVFAVATEDAVLLYDTQQAIPFGYISNIHYRQMSDLSWSQDGRILAISSTDGYCSIVTFEPRELGVIYHPEETNSTESDTSKSHIAETLLDIAKSAVTETQSDTSKSPVTETLLDTSKPAVTETLLNTSKPAVTETLLNTSKSAVVGTQSDTSKSAVAGTQLDTSKPIVIETELETLKSAVTKTEQMSISPDQNSVSFESQTEAGHEEHEELHLVLDDSDETPCHTGRDVLPCHTGRDETPCHTGRDETPCHTGRDETPCHTGSHVLPDTSKKHSVSCSTPTSAETGTGQHSTTQAHPSCTTSGRENTQTKETCANSNGLLGKDSLSGLKLGPSTNGGLSIKSATGQHRRIQLTTISLLKPK